MGVGPAIFASAGKRTEHWIPGVYSRRHTVSSETGVSANNLVILGYSYGGKPNTLYEFADKDEAKDILVGGELLEAVANAFNGSNDFVPQKVYAMRVNSATQSALTLKSGLNNIIKMKSADYGARNNQLKLWLKAGTEDNTRKVSVVFKGEEIEIDNIGQTMFSLLYVGDGESATVAVTKSTITLSALDDQSVATDSYTFNFKDFDSLDELIAAINDTDVYIATSLIQQPDVKADVLDCISSTALTETATVLYANCNALVDALKSIQFIDEVEYAENADRVLPDIMDGYEYFTGATDGTYSVSDWVNTLSALEVCDINCIATPSSNHSVHVLISNHCVEMSGVEKKKERMFLLGCAKGIQMNVALANAAELNTDFGSYVWNGAISNNPFTGAREEITPAMLACKDAGVEAALGISNPITNKVMKVNAFTEKLRNSQLNTLIKGGIMPFGENDDGQLVCIRAVTTYQGDNLALNERSMVREALYMDRDLRKAYSKRIGGYSEPSESDILNILNNKAKSWYLEDLITKSDQGELVFDAKVRFDGDKTYLTFSRYLRAPNNFIFITSVNRIYSSTIEV